MDNGLSAGPIIAIITFMAIIFMGMVCATDYFFERKNKKEKKATKNNLIFNF